MASNWSELQMELLDLIIKRLDAIVDIIRFKAVCSKWYRAAQLYMTSPLLMLPSDKKEEADDCRFFSVAENKIYKINNVFDGFHGAWCVGSSHGWLLILDKETKPHLLNPLSGALFQLPFINTLLPYQELQMYRSSPTFVELLVKFCFSKAILMSSDLCLSDVSRGKSFCIVVIYGLSSQRLAFCMPGDSTWTRFGGDDHEYLDITCHNGMLYSLSSKGLVEIWDFHGPSPKKVLVFELSTTVCQFLEAHTRFPDKIAFLIESKGDLLLVLMLQTDREFAIYKLDYSGKVWIPVETLSDQALFISENECRSVSTQNFPKLRENSIYFINSAKYSKIGRYNVGVFNFKEKKLDDEAEDNKYFRSIYLPVYWVALNPR
ncbi:putative F-box protein At5g55150 [Ziziphus jujuba]|uniref:F-box protein At5g55150 n=1 Tax=Ziziphus jujuba TaxID=326968 RepID=A0A6P4A0I1_ZIZJJ|nr:putative F-box protein At5g55150 [Ziziphus jujuba]XP_015888223.3 putative F-box protein At5g55150 [Ziziphus jujuba]